MAKNKKSWREKATEPHAEALADLVEKGIGCPKAVQLGGPGVVSDWIDEQYDNLERLAELEVEEAEAAEDAAENEAATLAALEAREAEDAKAREGAEVTTSQHSEADARAAQAGPDEWEQLVQDHDEQISGLNLALASFDERVAEIAKRVTAQESQGTDQWAAIEANTAGRIELGKAVEKRKQPRRPSEGKPRSRSKVKKA